MASVSVPYIVHDVDAAIVFYRQHLGFHEDMHPARPRSPCWRAAICVWYSVHRVRKVAEVRHCRMAPCRSVTGVGGKQVLVDDRPVTQSNCSSRLSQRPDSPARD